MSLRGETAVGEISMSSSQTPVTPALQRYCEEHARGDDEFLRALVADAHRRGLPAIWISPAQACFMALLLRATGARRVLEVGTLGGYSAIAMARALPADGEVVTVEAQPHHADFAREWIARSDVAGRISVITGRAAEILPALPANPPFDAVFLDADKGNQLLYVREAARLLRRNGLLLVDNAFAFGQLLDPHPSDPDVGAVRTSNASLARNPDFEGIIVAIGDGLWCATRR